MKVAAVAVAVAACCWRLQAAPRDPPNRFHAATATTGDEPSTQSRARIHTELAAGYFEIGNHGVALQEVNEALQRRSQLRGRATTCWGWCIWNCKDDRLRAEQFQRALRINPRDSDTNNNYGWFLCQRKREEESIKYFLAALRNPLYRNA